MSEELELEGKFKSAQDLGLTEKQYCGLIQTLAWLETGKLDHENEKGIGRFDMAHWRLKHDCGTVCCIGGTAEILAGLPIGEIADENNPELGSLFFPGSKDGWKSRTDLGHPGWKASTAQAAVALRGYLETGKADWDAAMKTPKYPKRRK